MTPYEAKAASSEFFYRKGTAWPRLVFRHMDTARDRLARRARAWTDF
jgi:hypothetical protein